MKVKDIAKVIEEIAPLKLAQGWDNVGLLIGDSKVGPITENLKRHFDEFI